MHNGASALDYIGLTYSNGPAAGNDEAALLNADGYTRWFNQPEFDGNGSPLLEYWAGKLATLPLPTAALNPYKIFTENLGVDDDYYEWIKTPGNADDRNIFLAGQAHSRRYELKFPMIGGVPVLEFQYAVVATWEPGDPTLTGDPAWYDPADFPASANVDEAFFIHASTGNSTLYYVDSSDIGGTLKADLEVFDWQGGTVGGNGVPTEIERILLESDFLPGGTLEMSKAQVASLAQPGTENSSVFQVEIPNCAPQNSGQADLWVIVESAGENGGSYDQGFPTQYPDPFRRAAFLRGAVNVSPVKVNIPPTITGIEDDLVGPGDYKHTVTKCDPPITYTVLYQDPDVGQIHTFKWWITLDGGTPGPAYLVTMPVDWSTYDAGDYDIYVEVNDGFDATQAGPFDITLLSIHWEFDTIATFTSAMFTQYSEFDDLGPAIAEENDHEIGLSWSATDTNGVADVDSGWWLKHSIDNGVTYGSDGYRDIGGNLTRGDNDKITAGRDNYSYATSRFDVPNHLNYISRVDPGWPAESGVFVANATRDMEITADAANYIYAFDDENGVIGEKHSTGPGTLLPWTWHQPPYVRFVVASNGYCSHVRSADMDSSDVVWLAYYSTNETQIRMAHSVGPSPIESWDSETVVYTAGPGISQVKNPCLFIDGSDIFHMCYTRKKASTNMYQLVYLKDDSGFTNPSEQIIVESQVEISDAHLSLGYKYGAEVIVLVYETGKSIFLVTMIDGVPMCPPQEIDDSVDDIDPDVILDSDQCDLHSVWSTKDGDNYDIARRNGVLIQD
jgi:hypothetical protein